MWQSLIATFVVVVVVVDVVCLELEFPQLNLNQINN